MKIPTWLKRYFYLDMLHSQGVHMSAPQIQEMTALGKLAAEQGY